MRLWNTTHPRAVTVWDPIFTVLALGFLTIATLMVASSTSGTPSPGLSPVATPSPSRSSFIGPVATPRALPTTASRGRMVTPSKTPRPRPAPSTAGSTAFEAWRHSRAAIGVANCESGPGPRAPKFDSYVGDIHQRYGKYQGKWQIGPAEWRTWGGLQFANSPALASEYQQDLVAYRYYLHSGWSPWACKSVL